ncbi:MAG: Non-canonical purine NTP phosphatase [Candidatus Heimdallarchaeota archaeon LC_3]|nr:MAG: Non-canonical purine NTP phosphatase [Candidatus Heimdallarchaeota archaeon LC_3]
MTILIGIGSKNKVKISATKAGFEECFPDRDLKFSSFLIESKVNSMPLTQDELIQGAKSRAEKALNILIRENQKTEVLFGVGLEGGMENNTILKKWFLCGWVAIIKNNQSNISVAKTASMILPEIIVKKVLSGSELAAVMDEITGMESTRENMGAFGILTNHLFTRHDSFREAIILSLAPYINKKDRKNLYDLK